MKHYTLAPVPYFCASSVMDEAQKIGAEVKAVIPVGAVQISSIVSADKPGAVPAVSIVVKSEHKPQIMLGKNKIAVIEAQY